MLSSCQTDIKYVTIEKTVVEQVYNAMPYSIMEFASNKRFAAGEMKKFAWQRRMNQTFELIWLRFWLDGHGEIPMSWYVFWMKQNNLIVSPPAILIVNDKLTEVEIAPTI